MDWSVGKFQACDGHRKSRYSTDTQRAYVRYSYTMPIIIVIMFVLIMAFIKKINIHEQTVYSNPNYSCMSVIEKLLRSYTCSCYI